MADTFSNPGNASYFADLGLTNIPLAPLHSAVWRPHPILPFIPIVGIPNGQTGWGVKTVADWSAAIAFSENTALTDQAHPTITSYNPTLVGRGFSYSETVQGRNRMTDEIYNRFSMLRDQKVIRVLFDDLTHVGANSIIALSSSVTDITVDAAGNFSLDGLFAGIAAVGRPAVCFIDARGVRGLMDSIRSEGSLMANTALTPQVKAMAAEYDGSQIHANGFVCEIGGCRIYQTNNNEGESSRLYENSNLIHGIIMADTRRRAEAARGNTMAQYDLIAPPITLEARDNPILGMRDVNEPDPEWASIDSGDLALNALGMSGKANLAKWMDIGNNVAGHKADFGWEFDPLLTSGEIRCIQYADSYV